MKKHIQFTMRNGNITVFAMKDNDISRNFQNLLPLTLDLQDVENAEKRSNLPSRFSIPESNTGYEPSTGDLCVSVPKGNLRIFYRGQSYTPGLLLLGHVVSGKQYLNQMEGFVTIKVIAGANTNEPSPEPSF